jgi:hypothetical protein
MPSGNDDMPKVRRQTMISKASYNWRKHLQTTPLSASWHIITTATPTLQITSRPRATRAFPHRGLGAGPDRAEARRHLRLGVAGYPDAVSCMDAGYPVHVWGCRCIPGTMTCRRFKDRMISKISEIDREHPWTTRQLFNSITLGHNNDPTLQIISWEGFCQA